jgi:hypothetical protein
MLCYFFSVLIHVRNIKLHMAIIRLAQRSELDLHCTQHRPTNVRLTRQLHSNYISQDRPIRS